MEQMGADYDSVSNHAQIDKKRNGAPPGFDFLSPLSVCFCSPVPIQFVILDWYFAVAWKPTWDFEVGGDL